MRKLDKLPKKEYTNWVLSWLIFFIGDIFSRLPWYWSANLYGKSMEVSSKYSDNLIEFEGPWEYLPADRIEEEYKGLLPKEVLHSYFKDISNLNSLLFNLNYYSKKYQVGVGFCFLERNTIARRPPILFELYDNLESICSDGWWFKQKDITSRRKLIKRAKKELYKRLLKDLENGKVHDFKERGK